MPIAARATKRHVLLLAVGLMAATGSACDASSGPTLTPNADTRQVTVVGAGQVQGTPDTLTVNAAIEFTASDVSGAMNQTSDRQRAVIDALVASGVDRKDISTTQVSLQPQLGSDGNDIVGYRASNTIDVKVRKLDSASQTLALIVGTGSNATRINSVNYSIDDDSQLVRDARARAFDDAKQRAAQYAQLSDMSLGKVISISESAGATPPTPLPTRGALEAAVPLEPGQQTVSFSVTVIWELS